MHDQPNDSHESTSSEIRVVFEIHRAEGTEAERLKLEQTRVLQEVTEWLAARRRSAPGQDHVA